MDDVKNQFVAAFKQCFAQGYDDHGGGKQLAIDASTVGDPKTIVFESDISLIKNYSPKNKKFPGQKKQKKIAQVFGYDWIEFLALGRGILENRIKSAENKKGSKTCNCCGKEIDADMNELSEIKELLLELKQDIDQLKKLPGSHIKQTDRSRGNM